MTTRKVSAIRELNSLQLDCGIGGIRQQLKDVSPEKVEELIEALGIHIAEDKNLQSPKYRSEWR